MVRHPDRFFCRDRNVGVTEAPDPSLPALRAIFIGGVAWEFGPDGLLGRGAAMITDDRRNRAGLHDGSRGMRHNNGPVFRLILFGALKHNHPAISKQAAAGVLFGGSLLPGPAGHAAPEFCGPVAVATLAEGPVILEPTFAPALDHWDDMVRFPGELAAVQVEKFFKLRMGEGAALLSQGLGVDLAVRANTLVPFEHEAPDVLRVRSHFPVVDALIRTKGPPALGDLEGALPAQSPAIGPARQARGIDKTGLRRCAVSTHNAQPGALAVATRPAC